MDKDAGSISLEHFSTMLNCAESVLLGVSDACDLKCDCMPRIASGFGGGIAANREICGALSGAIMALGLKFGRERGDDVEAKAAIYVKVTRLIDGFREKFGTVNCYELTGCDFKTEEGKARAQELNIHGDFCRKLVDYAANEAAKMIMEA